MLPNAPSSCRLFLCGANWVIGSQTLLKRQAVLQNECLASNSVSCYEFFLLISALSIHRTSGKDMILEQCLIGFN